MVYTYLFMGVLAVVPGDLRWPANRPANRPDRQGQARGARGAPVAEALEVRHGHLRQNTGQGTGQEGRGRALIGRNWQECGGLRAVGDGGTGPEEGCWP